MSPQQKPGNPVGAAPRGGGDSGRQLGREKDVKLVGERPGPRLATLRESDPTPDGTPAGTGPGRVAAASPRESFQMGRRKLVPPWLGRRWWVFILCVAAGTSGGILARSAQKVMYSGSAELIVASGSSSQGPGPANDAIALALTDASIIPSDQSTLQRVARETGVPLHQVAKSLSASAVSGTSVILVNYKAATRTEAISGVNAVARILNDGTPDSAIPDKSLVVVQLASSAVTVGTIHSYGVPLGVVLGFIVGAIAILAIERADPRVDDVEDLAEVTGTAASIFPGSIPVIELERNIAFASGGAANVTLAPLTRVEEYTAEILWKGLTMNADRSSMAFNVVTSISARNALLAQASGPTVLVVQPNTRSRVIQASVHRLQMLGRGPVWAVLAVGKPVHEPPK
jgi:capsular polysaccharide biosynthesis protein